MTAIFKRFNSGIFRRIRHLSVLIICLLLNACATLQTQVSHPVTLPASTPIVVGPIANHSDTPLANRRVESILVGLLQTRGFRKATAFPRIQSCDKLLYCPDEAIANDKLIAWARHHHVPYILTGSVNEWRYKVGLDGEPAAGVSLTLVHVKSHRVEWSGVGSIIGGSRSGLEEVGQKLLSTLLGSYRVL